MSSGRPFCFVIMPFRPEFHYFYLFLKRHIEQRHNIDCERGDAQVLTKPLLDKIADYIRSADVIIADCTGRNPNVFYELGLAHAIDKQVILITQDQLSDAPADIRHYEFVKYAPSQDADFVAKLDNALYNVFSSRYDDLYARARVFLKTFRDETKAHVIEATKETFVSRVSSAEQTKGIPSIDNEPALAELLLPRIIADTSDTEVMNEITSWLSKRAEKPKL